MGHQRSRRLYIAVLFLLLCCSAVAARRKRKETRQLEEPDDEDLIASDIRVHFLVELLGKKIYAYIRRPKYKFYIYITIGKLPSEESTIALLSTICNVLYGCAVWLGFIFLRRDYMLIGTLLTLHIGPAMILVLIGTVGMALAAFAIYPVTSVFVMWLFFLLTSQIAQAVGKYLGLDSDSDGDVDYLDLVHWAASTKVGRAIGVPALYEILNKINQDPFQEIHRRLDTISENIDSKSNFFPPTKNSGRRKSDKKVKFSGQK